MKNRVLITILIITCTASVLHIFYLQRNIKNIKVKNAEFVDQYFDLQHEYEMLFSDYMLLEEEHFIMSEEHEILASCCSNSGLQE